MNRRLNAMLRRIESSLEKIDHPATCPNDAFGQGRTLGNNAKIRELENLTQKLAGCQQLVQTDNEQEWLNGVKQTLKSRLDQVFNPTLVEA